MASWSSLSPWLENHTGINSITPVRGGGIKGVSKKRQKWNLLQVISIGPLVSSSLRTHSIVFLYPWGSCSNQSSITLKPVRNINSWAMGMWSAFCANKPFRELWPASVSEKLQESLVGSLQDWHLHCECPHFLSCSFVRAVIRYWHQGLYSGSTPCAEVSALLAQALHTFSTD